MNKPTRGLHPIYALLGLALSTPISSQGNQSQEFREPSKTITSAKWVDFKNDYVKSPLCTKDEATLWSCTSKQKNYALCATPNLSRATGYLQYRVTNREKLEFAYPATKRHPAGLFSYGTSANGDATVGFSNGQYEYTLSDPLRGNSSILISTPARETTIECAEGNQTLQLNYTMRLMWDSGIWNGH